MAPDPARILVVDDDPIILKMTLRLLENEGYETFSAATGEEALRQARAAAPDLILLDVMLPDISGVEVARQIKGEAEPGRPHLILLSGVKTESDAQALGLESGADGYITRPVANRELLARVQAALRLKQVEETLAEKNRALEEEVERRRQVEEALLQSEARRIQEERLAAVGQLTSGLAHALNNMLTSLTLRTDLALRMGTAPPHMRETLEKVQEKSTEMATLVQKLVDFSGKSLLRRTLLDLDGLARRQVARLHAVFPADVSVTLSVAEPEAAEAYVVRGDSGRLEEVIHNLALNALDAMPGGGALQVELDRGEAETICSGCGQSIAGEWVQLTVRDTGEGIDATTFSRIFEPFFTTRVPERRGLGLAQVLGIVAQHEGHVRVESVPGAGTAVHLYFPPANGEQTDGG